MIRHCFVGYFYGYLPDIKIDNDFNWRRCIIKAGIFFTGTGPILLLTTYGELSDATLVAKLAQKGIKKYIAYEVPEDLVKEKYGKHFDVYFERPLIAISVTLFHCGKGLGVRGKNRRLWPFKVYIEKTASPTLLKIPPFEAIRSRKLS